VVVRLQRYEEWVEILHAGGNTCAPSDCSTNSFTDRFTDGCADGCADSCANSSTDCCTDARFREHVGGHLRPVHARRRMCAEPELSAVLQ